MILMKTALRSYLQLFDSLNPGSHHEVFVDNEGFYDGLFTMAGCIPLIFKGIGQRYISVDACHHHAEGKQSGYSFLGVFETANHNIIPGVYALGPGETNDCWQRFLDHMTTGFTKVSLELTSYLLDPRTIVAGSSGLHT
jgi:hypothetical protein